MKRGILETEQEAARASQDMRAKHRRQAPTMPDVDIMAAMDRLRLEHETATQGTLAGGPPIKTLATFLQVPPDPRMDAAEKEKFSFESEHEPFLIKNWCGVGGASVAGTGGVYTPVRAKGGDQHGYTDLPSQQEASAWVPMVPAPGVEAIMVPSNPPPGGILIGSREGRSAYRILRSLGGGTYGGVFLAHKVDPKSMQNIPNSEVAIKIMAIDPRMFVAGPGPGQPRRLSPQAVNGAFAQYLVQRSYGGCMPHTVCMHDAFMLAIPEAPPLTGIKWHAAIVMEKMDGNVMDLVRKPEILTLPPDKRYAAILKIVCKMARGVFDLELQRIFHDDIKPQNFLYRKLGPDDYEIKVTDFDLGSFASRTAEVDSHQLTSIVIKQATRGNLERDSPRWASVPNIRILLRAGAKTTKFYEPPEYDLVRIIIDGMMGKDVTGPLTAAQNMIHMQLPPMALNTITHVSEFQPFRNKNIFNADWLSRMMAFELVSSIREMFLEAGLSPYYTIDHRYPADIMQPRGAMVHVSASTLIRMRPDGTENIVPPHPAYQSQQRAQEWGRLRMNTVHPGNLNPRQSQGVKELNTMLANVIAPRTPDPLNRSIHHPMQLITVAPGAILTLCANPNNFAAVRPTTGEVLHALLKTAIRSGVLPETNPRVDAVPTTLQSSLRAELLSFQ